MKTYAHISYTADVEAELPDDDGPRCPLHKCPVSACVSDAHLLTPLDPGHCIKCGKPVAVSDDTSPSEPVIHYECEADHETPDVDPNEHADRALFQARAGDIQLEAREGQIATALRLLLRARTRTVSAQERAQLHDQAILALGGEVPQ